MTSGLKNKENSIAGQSAAHFIAMDESLAALLVNNGIKVRDFILLSFLSDQGPMSVLRLARTVGIEPRVALRSLKRLSSANLLLREPATGDEEYEAVARLTTRGEEIAVKIVSQIN